MPTHKERLRLGYTHTNASGLRPGEWVHLEHFHLRVLSVSVGRRRTDVVFDSDSVPVRWWQNGYTLRVNYPRPNTV